MANSPPVSARFDRLESPVSASAEGSQPPRSGSMTAWLVLPRYFVSHAIRELRKRKFNWFLGWMSCFLVVCMAGLVYTLIEKAPVVFLQQAEAENGQVDMILRPLRGARSAFLNYSQVVLSTGFAPEQFGLHSSRHEVRAHLYPPACSRHIRGELGVDPQLRPEALYEGPEPGASALDYPALVTASNYRPPVFPTGRPVRATRNTNASRDLEELARNPYPGLPGPGNNWLCAAFSRECLPTLCAEHLQLQLPRQPSGQLRLRLIDSDRERMMGLGRNWQFPRIPPGETLIGSDVARLMVLHDGGAWGPGSAQGLVGRRFLLSLDLGPLLDALIQAALLEAPTPGSAHRNHSLLLREAVREFGVASVELRIAGVVDDTEGKLPEADSTAVLFVEHASFLPWLLEPIAGSAGSRLHPALWRRGMNASALARLVDPGYACNPDECGRRSDGAVGITASDPNLHLADLDFAPEDLVAEVPPVGLLRDLARPPGAAAERDLLSEHSSQILFNMPRRSEVYVSTDYDAVQRSVVDWASSQLYYAGFGEVTAELPLLEALSGTQFFSLFLGLLMSLILTIQSVLSAVLIYSQLTVSVEMRTFELGVHRMLGMTRSGLVGMLGTQAASYALPAWTLGMAAAALAARAALVQIENWVQIPIDKELTPTAVAVASVFGLCVPFIAAVLPIRAALGANLQDALDLKHSRVKAVKFSIERSEGDNLSAAWLAVGGGLAVFGFLIYYLMPLALLAFDLGLLFAIFFSLLLAMLCGLIILSMNLEHLMEAAVTFVFITWWEPRRIIPNLVLKNLTAHRLRNRKTSLMFGLALGFTLFITVAYRMELVTARYRMMKFAGAPLTAWDWRRDDILPPPRVRELEQLLADSAAQGVTRDWAWASASLEQAGAGAYGYRGPAGEPLVVSAAAAAMSPSSAARQPDWLAGPPAAAAEADGAYRPAYTSVYSLEALAAGEIPGAPAQGRAAVAEPPPQPSGAPNEGSLPAGTSGWWQESAIMNPGRAYEQPARVFGVSPNFFRLALTGDFLIARERSRRSGLPLTEQLYTAAGSQAALLSSSIGQWANIWGLSGEADDWLLGVQRRAASPDGLRLFRMRPAALLDSAPAFRFSQFHDDWRDEDVVVSLPSWLRIAESGGSRLDPVSSRPRPAVGLRRSLEGDGDRRLGGVHSLEDVPVSQVLVQVWDNATGAQRDDLVSRIDLLVDPYDMNLFDEREFGETMRQTDGVLSVVFSVATAVAMVLCFFSLMSSTHTNIHEHAKEIAVLRAVGLTAWDIQRVFIYEAFVLTMSASLLGVAVGTAMSWTMTVQRVLFTQLPVSLPFPTELLLVVAVCAIACAFLAAWAPARALTRKTVAAVMRTVM